MYVWIEGEGVLFFQSRLGRLPGSGKSPFTFLLPHFSRITPYLSDAWHSEQDIEDIYMDMIICSLYNTTLLLSALQLRALHSRPLHLSISHLRAPR